MKKNRIIAAVGAAAVALLLISCFGNKEDTKENPPENDDPPVSEQSIDSQTEASGDKLPFETVPHDESGVILPDETEPTPAETEPIETPHEEETSKPEIPSETEPQTIETEPAVLPTGETYMGGAVSETGTGVNIYVRWTAQSLGEGLYEVKVQTFLRSYSICVGERTDNKVTLGGESKLFTSPYIDFESDTLEENPLGEAVFRVTGQEFAMGLPLSVEWNFRGSYSDLDLETISANGLVMPLYD